MVIHVRNVWKRYGELIAVEDVCFSVQEGEVFGLLGPNGAGKTTTMELIEGLRKPDEGYIEIDGYDTVSDRQHVKQLIGIQLQATALFGKLTVREILQLYSSFYPQTESIDRILRQFRLEEKADDWVDNLSGGQKQRLAIAIAVIHRPKIVFLDEPTTGLDPQARRGLWEIINTLKQSGKTVFLSTHYMEEAETLCDRIAIMDEGRIIALDTPAQLIRQLDSDSIIEFEPGETPIDQLSQLPGIKQVNVEQGGTTRLLTDDLPLSLKALIRYAGETTMDLSGLRTRSATLEDVFLHLTGKRLSE